MYTILKQQIYIHFDRLRIALSLINTHNDLPVDVICKGKVEPTKCTKLLLRVHHLNIAATLDPVSRFLESPFALEETFKGRNSHFLVSNRLRRRLVALMASQEESDVTPKPWLSPRHDDSSVESFEKDLAAAIVSDHAQEFDRATERRVLRRIDLYLIPWMWLGYGFVYYDKVREGIEFRG